MNNFSKQIIQNLVNTFHTNHDTLSQSHQWFGICPIGIEIEVKWRYYFPELWEKYLQNTKFKDLDIKKQEQLSLECSEIEKTLIPQLKLTEKCGIEKGLDKYYEFAFQPVTDIYLIYDQIHILKDLNLIPPGEHSLHITIGDLGTNKDSYYFLLLLEMLLCSKERIQSAFHSENKSLSSTWARKGMGGLFLKQASELKYGYQKAIEMRTLQLCDNHDVLQVLKVVSQISDIIFNKNHSQLDHKTVVWTTFVKDIQDILSQHKLIDTNWKKPNLTPNYWTDYINNFDSLKEKIIPLFEKRLLPIFDIVEKKKNKISI